jgi:hypothetical protein
MWRITSCIWPKAASHRNIAERPLLVKADSQVELALKKWSILSLLVQADFAWASGPSAAVSMPI